MWRSPRRRTLLASMLVAFAVGCVWILTYSTTTSSGEGHHVAPSVGGGDSAAASALRDAKRRAANAVHARLPSSNEDDEDEEDDYDGSSEQRSRSHAQLAQARLNAQMDLRGFHGLRVGGGDRRSEGLFGTNETGYRRRRLQVVKAGGVPKEGFGSSLGFLIPAVSIAQLLDADFLVSQTAAMFGFRASDYINGGVELEGGGRVCDILQVLLDEPMVSLGPFQSRMDHALGMLDALYKRAVNLCRGEENGDLFWSEWARREIRRCDTLIINDYRSTSHYFNYCAEAWWRGVIEAYVPATRKTPDQLTSRTGARESIAIHYRWGDMYKNILQGEAKWRFNMVKVAHVVDVIREEHPGISVDVFLKPSERNESEQEMREMLLPLSGDYNIVHARSDVEELAMMGQAMYFIGNSGSFSIAAAATRRASVVITSDTSSGRARLEMMQLNKLLFYDEMTDEDLRMAVRSARKGGKE